MVSSQLASSGVLPHLPCRFKIRLQGNVHQRIFASVCLISLLFLAALAALYLTLVGEWVSATLEF